MTHHDIRRAHGLWLHLKQAHKDLTEMAQVWRAVAQHMEPEAAEAALDCATRLEMYVATWHKPLKMYVATWHKPLSEQPAPSVESVPAWAEKLASEWEARAKEQTRETAEKFGPAASVMGPVLEALVSGMAAELRERARGRQ